MENINQLISSIIQVSFDNLPVNDVWEKYEIDTYALRKIVEINAFYFQNEGKKVSFNPKYQGQVDRNDDLTFLFLDLRKVMYELSSNQGAWFHCKISVYPDGKFETNFNYDDQPDFAYEPGKDKFIDDLKFFPREDKSKPEWLKIIVNS